MFEDFHTKVDQSRLIWKSTLIFSWMYNSWVVKDGFENLELAPNDVLRAKVFTLVLFACSIQHNHYGSKGQKYHEKMLMETNARRMAVSWFSISKWAVEKIITAACANLEHQLTVNYLALPYCLISDHVNCESIALFNLFTYLSIF